MDVGEGGSLFYARREGGKREGKLIFALDGQKRNLQPNTKNSKGKRKLAFAAYEVTGGKGIS